MRRSVRRAVWVGVLFAFAFGARADERPVQPGERFGGTALDVRAPRGEGWVVRESATELLFGRRGARARETTVATVSFFELPAGEARRPEEIVAFIRRMTEADFSRERFADALATYAYSEIDGLGCVHYVASGLDRQAPGGPLTQAMYALYCRYPLRENFGLALVYSQRARAIDTDLAQQAQAFFDGVRVPKASDGTPDVRANDATETPAPDGAALRPEPPESSPADDADAKTPRGD